MVRHDRQHVFSVIVLALAIVLLVFHGCGTLDPPLRNRWNQVNAILHGADERFASTVYRLLERGVDSAYLWQAFHHPHTTFLPEMLKINVTGFLRKVDYSHNWSETSIATCAEFLYRHAEALSHAEREFGVPKEIITSVLWVETKFGKFTGLHHVWSVYASLAAADHMENVRANQQLYRDSITDPVRLERLDSMVVARSQRKAAWALEQLVALYHCLKDSSLDVLTLRGSWAGAFGIPQFIPTSYRLWARDGDGDGMVDLFNINDAIVSVANYLKTNGWGPQRARQEAALFHYNNSRDYVQCILTVAQRLKNNELR